MNPRTIEIQVAQVMKLTVLLTLVLNQIQNIEKEIESGLTNLTLTGTAVAIFLERQIGLILSWAQAIL